MAKQGVRYLETQKLTDAANTLDGCINKYNDVVKDIVSKTDQLLATWMGEGKTAFEKDYSTIYRQLEDISEVMYDLYDALIDAAATYIKTDEEIAKNLTMSS